MFYDWQIAIVSLMGGATVVYGVSQLPELTSPGRLSEPGQAQAALEAAIRGERSFCESQTVNLNCVCFAQTSGQILSHNSPKVKSARYANQRDLARGQAAQSC